MGMNVKILLGSIVMHLATLSGLIYKWVKETGRIKASLYGFLNIK